ncbi:MAG: hypothetical protein HN929_08660 [Chloroflexi bacterium]|jgi:hypothetical protein|nr:hypothetical protein [Chloroflexota bacterium]MBT7081521.1 hypothetical protein [Chloroflexota bacterium]MBT7288998.1 hypothetical protein [Chloroflexota bacterium]
MRVTGGVLSILSGISVLIIGIFLVATASLFDNYTVDQSSASVSFWGIVWILFGLMAIVGGAYAFIKKHWTISIAGTVCVLIALTLAYVVAWRAIIFSWWVLVMAIVALVAFIVDRKSFVDQEQ